MQSQYHARITQAMLGEQFTPVALAEVIAANVTQDSLPSIFGVEARRHYCDPDMAQSAAYLADEHAQIAELATQPGQEARQRAALGRLLHTVQDFYAHSNYIDLWLLSKGILPNAWACGAYEAHAGLNYAGPDYDRTVGTIEDMDATVLCHPELQVGDWVLWRDLVFYVPVVGQIVRRVWVPRNSHEAMHLDSPARGPRFKLAIATAQQRTLREYRKAVQAIVQVGGTAALDRFHGVTLPVPTRQPLWAGAQTQRLS